MAPFAESKNRPQFVDGDIESLLMALSTYDDDDSSSSSSSSSSDIPNGEQERRQDHDIEQQQRKQDVDIPLLESSSHSSSSSSTSSHSGKKSVSFNPHVALTTIPHRSSFTKQEKRLMFMCSKEYNTARADARVTADLFSEWGEMKGKTLGDTKASDIEDDEICFLGLEGHTVVGRTLRKSLRGRAQRIVYEKQFDDKTGKRYKPGVFAQIIAKEYARISESASSFAWLRALKTKDQIRDYTEDETDGEASCTKKKKKPLRLSS